jgi:glutamyl-Q tRNA(Asp) synthetase
MVTGGRPTPKEVVTRFAPSPNGFLHLGHAYAALMAFDPAAHGRFLLRIEDIDRGRSRPEFEAAICEDLAWLGLVWEEPVRRQSEHMDDYARALARLDGMDVLYQCFCTRREISEEVTRAGIAPHGEDGPPYPGTCRRLDAAERRARIHAGEAYSSRLDMKAAIEQAGPIMWFDDTRGEARSADPSRHGDIVIASKEAPTSYHLSVTVDDALQGVTLVTRGGDLEPVTDIHRLLQALLVLPSPAYRHHRLLIDAGGRRLAKRDGALSIRALREAGHGPDAVRAMALGGGLDDNVGVARTIGGARAAQEAR